MRRIDLLDEDTRCGREHSLADHGYAFSNGSAREAPFDGSAPRPKPGSSARDALLSHAEPPSRFSLDQAPAATASNGCHQGCPGSRGGRHCRAFFRVRAWPGRGEPGRSRERRRACPVLLSPEAFFAWPTRRSQPARRSRCGAGQWKPRAAGATLADDVDTADRAYFSQIFVFLTEIRYRTPH
jgi:hypothetical protein